MSRRGGRGARSRRWSLSAVAPEVVVDRALLVQKSKTEYEFEARKELRSLIGRYHGRVLDAAVDLHHRMVNLYGDEWDPVRYRRLDVRGQPDNNYYYLSTVRRFLNLAALCLRFEQQPTFIDARIAERGDRELLYFIRAFRWAMVSEKPFVISEATRTVRLATTSIRTSTARCASSSAPSSRSSTSERSRRCSLADMTSSPYSITSMGFHPESLDSGGIGSCSCTYW
jgi:hypothetical protein